MTTNDRRGAQNSHWKGGRQKSGNGYVHVIVPEHPQADDRGRVYEHVIIAERALGKYLPLGAVVHHVNGVRDDNRPENLVLCPDQAYHLLLHRRQRALRACGHATWVQCRYCRQWGALESMYLKERKVQGPLSYHRACHAAANKAAYHAKRAR